MAHVRRHVADRPELAVAAALLVLLLATAGRYGWFRDELYFLAAGRHLDWGYPDQPVFTPWIVATLHDLGGGSLTVVRASAAVAACGSVLLVAALAGELGGGRRARLLAATGWAVGGWTLNTGHFVETGSFELPAALAMLLFTLRAVRTGRPVWLAAAGACLGAGLLAKFTIGLVAACVLVALLAFGPRRLLLTRWALPGAVLTVAGAAPYLVWQAAHGWPQRDLAASIATVPDNDVTGVLWAQCTVLAPYLVPVLVAGVVGLARDRRHRAVLWAYPMLVTLLILTRGRGYYAASLVAVLAAAGSVTIERWWRRDARGTVRGRLERRVAAGLLVAGLLVSLAGNAWYALPLIPVERLEASGANRLNGLLGDQVGWPDLVRQVASVRDRIPPAGRSGLVVFTANYGEAGAIDLYGPALNLPPAVSGHNGYGYWGPPAESGGPVIVVGYQPDSAVAALFPDCRPRGVVGNRFGVTNVERGMPILLCRPPRAGWRATWPRLTHDDLGVTLSAEEKAANLRGSAR